MWMLIPLTAIIIGGLIPITAIITAHKRSAMKLQLNLVEKEIQLEQLKLETYTVETEKMRLELDHSQQQLLEMSKR